MEVNTRNINMFLLLRLPSAFICGVRLKHIDRQSCRVSVKHLWINQNPFKSMYFAVQAMAAELSTGALVMKEIQISKRNISMLVTANKSIFIKRATGRINFICNDGALVSEALSVAIATSEKQVLILKSTGENEAGEKVCEMEFEWNIKLRDANK